MPFLNVDDDFTEHPKIVVLSDAAFRLQMSGMRYCAKFKTNGLVPADDRLLRRIVPNFKPTALKELLDGKVWHSPGDGCGTKHCLIGDTDSYVVHDYLQWNKSKEWWDKKRTADAERLANWRAGQRKGTDEHDE